MHNILILEDNIECQNGLKEIIALVISNVNVHTAMNISEAEGIIKLIGNIEEFKMYIT